MTAGVFGAMAAFGGVSYATNSVQHAVGVSNSNNKGWNYTPSCDQYGHKGKKDKKDGQYGSGGFNPPSFNEGGYGFGGFGGFRW